jgi:hypothetical protein
LFPRTLYIQDGILHVKHADDILATGRGYQEYYPLSECLWYKGYADYIRLSPYGIFFSPIGICKSIIIYHLPTYRAIECGFTRSSFKEWCDVLQSNNVKECRQRLAVEPLAVILSFFGGIMVNFTDLLWNLTTAYPFIGYTIMYLNPLIATIFGSILCGNDLFFYDKKYWMVGLFLLSFSGGLALFHYYFANVIL